MARNWLQAFRAASYRGVPFQVDGEDAEGARRLSISPIAYAETSVIEDMGRDPRRMRLTAYCVGDEADSAAKALIAALDRKGAGLLALPMLPSLRARVEHWSLSRRKDYAGYVGVDIDFVEEGLAAVPFGASTGSAQAIGALISAGAAVLSSAFSERAKAMPRAEFVREAAAADLARNRFLASVPLALAGAAKPREIALAEDAIVSAVDAFSSAPGPAAGAITLGWRSLALFADASAVPDLARSALAEAGATVATLFGVAEAASEVTALSAAVLRGVYPARQDATAERGRLQAAAAPVIEIAGQLGDEALGFVEDATGQAARALSAIATNRAPLVRVETTISLSAIRAAFELYGDANRAGELIDRNRIATAAFMPVGFEALAL